jgi:hypothetical protein
MDTKCEEYYYLLECDAVWSGRSLNLCHTGRFHIPEDSSAHIHRCENVSSNEEQCIFCEVDTEFLNIIDEFRASDG